MPELWEMYRSSFQAHTNIYLLLFGLMLLNWTLETRKWMYLLSKEVKLPFFKAFQAVWTGVSVSLFTPNRIGEFGGRLLFIEPDKRVASVSATLAGSVGQLTATMLFGSIALPFYLVYGGNPDLAAGNWVLFAMPIILAAILLLYFQVTNVSRWLESRRWHEKIKKTFRVLANYSRDELFVGLWFSCIRYLVFALQLGLVLYVLIDFYEFDLAWVSMVVGSYFLIQTIIPSVALSEIGVRGAILTFLLIDDLPDKDLAPLILAGTVLWFVNIIVPAIVGAFFLARTKIKMGS